MKKHLVYSSLLLLLSLLHALPVFPQADSLLRTAPERIAKYRMAPVDILVTDSKGNPVKDAVVRVEQTKHAFLFGCNIFPLYRFEGEKHQLYAREFSSLFNYATLPFYWGQYEPVRGDISKAQESNHKIAQWCKVYQIETKGHPLVWHEVYPKWGPLDPDSVKESQRARITSIVPEFKGEIHRWDVINEATAAGLFKTGVSNWIARDGAVKVVKTTLEWAHKADPEALLVYNDYKIDSVHFDLIRQLLNEKAPVDIIGLQSHMHAQEWPLEKVWNMCEQYAVFGKPLHFTELTVISGKNGWDLPKPWSSTPEGEARQADYVEKLYTLLFSHPAVEAITWWDFQDGSWMGAPSGLVRSDLSPKDAYTRLLKLVKNDWWTRKSLRTGEQGTCSLTGFQGDYKLTVYKGGKMVEANELLRKGKNQWTIVLR